ncbi:Sulfite efflux pump SSU1 [Smittium mucronatum]|uniref:Sulfite efflux pump SSU1 n=1 Tax=Smittium mucronatum TaxID=133383 RepID=A0A1R0GL93_9FUNG|nr:Sulfite efflux pump SSU1 [Smittium mucronatum]
MLFIIIVVPFYKLSIQEHSLEKMQGTWLLPIVPAIIMAATGSIVSQVQEYERAKFMVLLSYIIWGLGVLPSLCIIAFLYSKTAIYNLPPAEQLASIILPLGTLGQGSFAIVNLGIEANRLFSETGKEFVPVDMIGQIALAGGTLVGLVFWGFGLFWVVLSASCVIYGIKKNDIKFNIGWWGITFPLGVFISATNNFGNLLENDGFKAFGSFLTVCIFIFWLLCMVNTIKGVCTTKLFNDPCFALPTVSKPALKP